MMAEDSRRRRTERLRRRLASEGLLVTPPAPESAPSREQAREGARGTDGAVSEARDEGGRG